jgi:hypothetical protein
MYQTTNFQHKEYIHRTNGVFKNNLIPNLYKFALNLMLKKIEIFGDQQYPACYLVTTVTSRGPCAALFAVVPG